MPKPHEHGTCQVCDMFENVGHWGPPVGGVTVHARVRWPDDPHFDTYFSGGYNWLNGPDGKPDWEHRTPPAPGS